MEQKPYLQTFISKVSQTIERSESQWKDNRFASVNDSDSEAQDDDDFGQYEQFMEKYRGKNGDIKPLGLLIYRKFICGLIILCFILTVISLPVALLYSVGGGISDFQKNASFSKSLLLFSIANLPHYRFDNLSEEDLTSIRLHRNLAIGLDVFGILIVIGFLLYWRIIVTKMTNSYVAKSPSPNLYCLQVKNIIGRSQQQLSNHFKKFGKLAQISCIYNTKNLLTQLTKLVKLINKYNHLIRSNNNDVKKQQYMLDRIDNCYEEIAENYLKRPHQPEIKQCFICYEDIRTRNKVADLYKYGIMPEKLGFQQSVQQQLLQHQEQQEPVENSETSDSIFMKDHQNIPIVKKCKYEPLTLNWQNFDLDRYSQIAKTACQAVLLIVMLFMILLALFLLNINSSHIKTQLIQNNSTSVDSQSPISYEQLLKNNPSGTNPQIIYTFCASLTYSTFKWQYYSLCSEYFSIEGNKFALMLLFSLLVAVINLMTNRILWALVAFRQYRTLAERNRFLIKSIFMFSLINSAVLILFIREQYIGPTLRQIVTFIFGFKDQVMQVTLYSEYNRQWYMNIGNQLMMNYVVSLLVLPHFHIILHWVRKMIRQYQAKKTNKPSIDPNFNYCTFYAMSLKALFFTMLYSSCMPVFYLLCFLALNVQLYVGKFLLKKFVKQPVYVDNNAIQVAVDMVPYSLLFHCFLNIFFFNVDEIFPNEDSYFHMQLNFVDRNLRRMHGGAIYLLMMLLIGLFIWNRSRIYTILIKYSLGIDSSTIQCDLAMKFTELKNNPAFLSSYRMRDNPKYKIIYKAMILFESHMRKIAKAKTNANKESTGTMQKDSAVSQSNAYNFEISSQLSSFTNRQNQQQITPSTVIRCHTNQKQNKTLISQQIQQFDAYQTDEQQQQNNAEEICKKAYEATFSSAENFQRKI